MSAFALGQARIYDPPAAFDEVPLPEVLSIWDGTGITAGPGDCVPYERFPPLELLAIAAFCGVCLLVFRKRLPGVVLIVGVAVGATLVWHLVLVPGWTDVPSVAARLAEPPTGDGAVADCGYEDVVAAARSGDATIVDARLPDAYRFGHIPTATSLPVTAGYLEWRARLREIPSDRPIIVYCTNIRCPWARHVAGMLATKGYGSVSVFAGGMEEWNGRMRSNIR